MLGMSIFWGFLPQACARKSQVALLSAGLLLSQIAVLRPLSYFKKICHQAGEDISRSGQNAINIGLPTIWQGAYFLRNGFSN
jgi:hypothetical protein